MSKENIYKLANQAGLECSQEILEKFALLLIQESVKIMRINENLPYGFFYAKDVNTHELSIKIHFGLDKK